MAVKAEDDFMVVAGARQLGYWEAPMTRLLCWRRRSCIVGLLVWTSPVQKEEVLLLLSKAHRAYGRKSCTARGEETTPQDFDVVAGREGGA
jgi:hypothetical protein